MKTETELLTSMASYCSGAERCRADVRRKLRDTGCDEALTERIINRLVSEGFIDEKRFARAFAGDKFRFNHWGRVKISYELKLKNINQELCADAIDAIDEDEYKSSLNTLLEQKRRTIRHASQEDCYYRLLRFASSRGFETSLIVAELKKMLKNVDYDKLT